MLFKIGYKVIDTLGQYIKYGDGWEIIADPKTVDYNPTIDISRAGLIRYLISVYGEQSTEQSNYIFNRMKEQGFPMCYTSFRTKNLKLIQTKGIAKKLVNAMVYVGIPIEGLFDGKNIVKNDLRCNSFDFRLYKVKFREEPN